MSSPPARRAKRLLYGRFATLAATTDGMLSPAVYRRLHQTVVRAPDLDVVEIGAAAGSATIAMSWAMAASRKQSGIVTVERFEGGSRDQYGDRDANRRRFDDNIERLADPSRIRLFDGDLDLTNGAAVLDLVRTDALAGFVHDADGMLHRDVLLFLPHVHARGFVVVDDVHPTRAAKHARTFRLMELLVEWRLLEVETKIRDTVFARPHPDADVGRLDLERCESVVAEVAAAFGGPSGP